MNRKKFLKASLATLGLGLAFPSLIRGSKEDLTIDILPEDSELIQKPSRVFEYPLRPDECFQAFRVQLTDVLYDDITVSLAAISPTGKEQDLGTHGPTPARSGGKINYVMMPKGEVSIIRVTYSYKYAIGKVILHIPVSRFFEGAYSWSACRCVKNSAGSLSLMGRVEFSDGHVMDIMQSPWDTPGFVVEHWDDRVEIHLSG